MLVGDFDFLLPKLGEGIDVLITLMLGFGFFIADSGSDYSSINFTKLINIYIIVVSIINGPLELCLKLLREVGWIC